MFDKTKEALRRAGKNAGRLAKVAVGVGAGALSLIASHDEGRRQGYREGIDDARHVFECFLGQALTNENSSPEDKKMAEELCAGLKIPAEIR